MGVTEKLYTNRMENLFHISKGYSKNENHAKLDRLNAFCIAQRIL